jgi:phosphoribosyl 1,2-cyclic phosphodiesterase
MHLQVLSSGSGGNAALVRAGDTALLVDAGLPGPDMEARLDAARLGHGGLDHVLVSHGHLDHARSAGVLARRHHALLHCSEAIMSNASIRRHKRLATLTIGRSSVLENPRGSDGVTVTPVEIPHDAPPTVAFRIEHGGRTAVILTDMGVPRPEVAERLRGAHVLVLEFNHDAELLASGPYPAGLKRRISGNAGHLSNDQAADMLRGMADGNLHTLVLAHLSAHNNTPALALACAHAALDAVGLRGVRVLVASQDEVGLNLEV